MLIYSLALEWVHIPLETKDPLTAAILAGVLSGVGLALFTAWWVHRRNGHSQHGAEKALRNSDWHNFQYN